MQTRLVSTESPARRTPVHRQNLALATCAGVEEATPPDGDARGCENSAGTCIGEEGKVVEEGEGEIAEGTAPAAPLHGEEIYNQ